MLFPEAPLRSLRNYEGLKMKKATAFAFCLIMAASVAQLHAHSPALPLGAGKVGLSWYWRLGSGINLGMLFSLNETGQLTELDVLPLTPEYNFAYGGTVMLFEYGITDFWSVGIQANFFDLVLNGIRYQFWKLYPSVFTDFNIVKLDTYLLNTSAEFQVAPLFPTPDACYPGDGLFNLFLTASNNFSFIRSEPFDLFGYADIKLITTWINQTFDVYYLTEGPYDLALSIFPASPDGVSVQYGAMSKIAIALGLEMRWRHFWFNLGYNLEILEFSLTHRYYSFLLGNLETLFWENIAASNIEFSWRWRL
jgi:hypothetical protein